MTKAIDTFISSIGFDNIAYLLCGSVISGLMLGIMVGLHHKNSQR